MKRIFKDDTLDRLKRGVLFIEANLAGSLNLSAVASHAAISVYHFHRVFRGHFGVPVMDYVRRRRLSVSAERLVVGRARILDVALESGFGSQAAFSRAFRKMYLTSPAAYRRRGKHAPWMSAASLVDALPDDLDLHPRIIRKEAFAVVGRAANFTAQTLPQIGTLWSEFFRRVDGAHITRCYGICESVPAIHDAELAYMVAGDIAALTTVSDGLEAREIPGGDYLVFAYQGPLSRIRNAIGYLRGVWLPGSKYRQRHAPQIEVYDGELARKSPRPNVEFWIPIHTHKNRKSAP